MGEESRRDAGADSHFGEPVALGELLQLVGHRHRPRSPGRPHAADPMQWIRIGQHRPQLWQGRGVSNGEQRTDGVGARAIVSSRDHRFDKFDATAIQSHQRLDRIGTDTGIVVPQGFAYGLDTVG